VTSDRHADGQGSLASPPATEETGEAAAPARGARLGPYEVVGELGRGGMGVVLKAVRADDAYRKVVAVKLVPAAGLSARARERFLEERQILAGLEHPNIARLLDGGTTADGVPYLVMELVEGERIDVWCQARDLGVDARLRLFLEVAAAVHHAHRNLVVHRDIKPGNVLVTSDGVPKLLDFGVARFATGDGDATLTAASALTPAYASPEQLLQDGPIGTASDVYSLGVLLHELLTGQRPRRSGGGDGELLATAAGLEPERPSVTAPPALRRRLRGDLDVILLTALRTAPEARYGSAEAFADDVRRHLDGRPVRARPPTLTYRLSKFTRRNPGAVAALTLAIVALAGGVVATRREAARADAERVVAERRFAEARRIAHAMLFELHDAVAPLPGSTAARKLLVTRGLEYLDGVAREAGGDRSLCLELARAYVRIGDVQGGVFNANLGDDAGARESYGRAVALADRCGSGDAEGASALGAALRARAAARALAGDALAGREDAARALGLARAHVDGRAGGRVELAQALAALAFATYHVGDLAASREASEEGVRVLEAGVPGAPSEQVQGLLAGAHWQLAGTLWGLTDRRGAAEHYERARTLQEAALARDPRNVRIRRQLAFTLESLGTVRGQLEQPSVDVLERAVELRRQLAADDPADADARLYALYAQKNLALALVATNRGTEAAPLLASVLGQLRAAAAKGAPSRRMRVLLAELLGTRALLLREGARRSPASARPAALREERDELTAARAAWAALEAEGPLNGQERRIMTSLGERLEAIDAELARAR